MKGDFDALLTVSPTEESAQRQKPVVLNLRKRNSFKPQGSLDSAGSFVSAASSASEPENVRQVTAAQTGDDGRAERAASRPMADEDDQLSSAGRECRTAKKPAPPHLDNGAEGSIEFPHKDNGSTAVSEADMGSSSESVVPRMETEASDQGPTPPNEDDPGAAAQPQEAAPAASSSSPGPAEGFAEALADMRLQPEESAELPVSTLRAGRCFYGYVSAEDEPLPSSAAAPSSSGAAVQDISAEERDLLAAASRAGRAESSGRLDSKRHGEEEVWQERKGAAEAEHPMSSFEAPSFAAWEPRDTRGADGLGKGSDEEEGQELGVWRGGSHESASTSAAGSSLDSHAAFSYELRCIGGDAPETALHQLGQVRHLLHG